MYMLAAIVAILTGVAGASQEKARWHLLDRECGNEWVTVLADGLFDVRGRCEGDDIRTLHLEVTSKAGRDVGALRSFSLGFCGEILGAEAPTGWKASVLERSASFGQPAKVVWEVLEDNSSRRTSASARRTGFSLKLRPGWRRAIRFDVMWEDSSTISSSPHDCGDLPRR